MKKRLFITIFILLLTIPIVAKEQPEYILRFSRLALMAPSDQSQYLEEVRSLFKGNKNLKIDQLLASYSGNNNCRKKNQRTCFIGLYGENQCAKKRGPSGQLCASESINKKIQFRYFQQANLNQIKWIEFANNVSSICKNKRKAKICRMLIMLKGKTEKTVKLIEPIPEGVL